MTAFPRVRVRRPGKELRERAIALVLAVLLSPLFVAIALAIKVEAMIRGEARGGIFFAEDRISRGRTIRLLKFRTLTASALATLAPGPTHIATLEKQGQLTHVGRLVRQWYLDELPQLLNIVRGDMFLIGTRPCPIEVYEREIREGITRKRDMPAGLIGPVQAHKGDPAAPDEYELDERYWESFQTYGGWRLLALDLGIVLRSLVVQLKHKGI